MAVILVLLVSLAASHQFSFERHHSPIFVQDLSTQVSYRFTSDSEITLQLDLSDQFTTEVYFNVNDDERIYSVAHSVVLEPFECLQVDF